jgi:pyruvate formate lyase activating enzyme
MVPILWIKENKKVKCKLCLHKCSLKEGEEGICKVRFVKNGNLVLKNFMQINYEEKDIEDVNIFHLFPFSKTLEIFGKGNNLDAKFFEVKNVEKIDLENFTSSIPQNIKTITFSFEETLMYIETAYRLAKIFFRKGLKNVFTTNAYFSANLTKAISKYFEVGRIIVYNSLDKKFYSSLKAEKIEEIMKTITYLHRQLKHIEVINFVDRKNDIRSFSEFLVSLSSEIPLHIVSKNLEFDEIRRIVEEAEKSGLRYVYSRDIFKIDTKCYNCNFLLIDRINKVVNVTNNRCPNCGVKLNMIF